MITVKGKVTLNGFEPVVDIHELVNGWIDTTLLPPTPDEIDVVCPRCGYTFKYKINKDDYKKSVVSQRTKDITPVVEQKNEEPEAISAADNQDEKKNKINQNKAELEQKTKKDFEQQEQQKKDINSTWSF